VLVLNRRRGESIYVEEDIDICVLRSTHQAVWLRIAGERIAPPLLLGATALSSEEVRLEIGAPLRAHVDGHEVRIEVASPGQLSVAAHATLSFHCRPGHVAKVGGDLEVGVGPTEHGHPSLTLGGRVIGTHLRLALIRLSTSCVRLGIDAPGRRVYRKELWDALVATNTASADASGVDFDGAGAGSGVMCPRDDDAPLRAAL
jgi:sRNA-binding carbon storage regulator CsrA